MMKDDENKTKTLQNHVQRSAEERSNKRLQKQCKQEQIVLERSVRLNMDPGRVH